MADWEALVSERLGALDVHRGQRPEIVAELASHLEDFYLEKCARGLSEPVAMELTLAQVLDWRALTQNIRLAKREEGIYERSDEKLLVAGTRRIHCFDGVADVSATGDSH
jgi:hypothetical protein